MRSLKTVLRGVTLATVTVACTLPTLAAAPGQEATVVTVGDARKSTRDATLWGFASRYVPPVQSGEDRDRSREIQRYVLAIQLYHNALASSRNQGRPITERDLIFKGEKLYLPPQDVLDKIVGMMPTDPKQGITAAKRDLLMHTVLTDVSRNKDLIAKSKAGTNLTTEVLTAAAEVKGVSETAEGIENGQGTPGSGRTLMARMTPDQELDDRAEPGETTLLGPDGQPVTPAEGPDAGAANPVEPNLLGITFKENEVALEQALAIAESGAKDATNPNRAKFEELATRIKAELAKRKAEAEKRKQEADKTPAPAPDKGQQTASTGPATAGAAGSTSRTATDKPAGDSAQSSGSAPVTELPPDETIEMEYVPDWYLKALQEWNLQQYWQTRSAKADAPKRGKKKILDPLTGQEREVDDTDDPFSQFSDELANYQTQTGQVEKRTDTK